MRISCSAAEQYHLVSSFKKRFLFLTFIERRTYAHPEVAGTDDSHIARESVCENQRAVVHFLRAKGHAPGELVKEMLTGYHKGRGA
jgi:hypothetical protein